MDFTELKKYVLYLDNLTDKQLHIEKVFIDLSLEEFELKKQILDSLLDDEDEN